jgi:hypothetical protein
MGAEKTLGQNDKVSQVYVDPEVEYKKSLSAISDVRKKKIYKFFILFR